jgi:hypothetical protein
MEAIRISETSVDIYLTTRRQFIPEDCTSFSKTDHPIKHSTARDKNTDFIMIYKVHMEGLFFNVMNNSQNRTTSNFFICAE